MAKKYDKSSYGEPRDLANMPTDTLKLCKLSNGETIIGYVQHPEVQNIFKVIDDGTTIYLEGFMYPQSQDTTISIKYDFVMATSIPDDNLKNLYLQFYTQLLGE